MNFWGHTKTGYPTRVRPAVPGRHGPTTRHPGGGFPALGRIRSINLSGNNFGDAGAAMLASLLERKVVPRLRVLRVHHNPISDEGRAKLRVVAAACSVSLESYIPERRPTPAVRRAHHAPGELPLTPPLVQMQSSRSEASSGELPLHVLVRQQV